MCSVGEAPGTSLGTPDLNYFFFLLFFFIRLYNQMV